MRKLLMVMLVSIATPICIASGLPDEACRAKTGWTPVSQEQGEYNRLTLHCAQIAEQYTALGGGRSSALGCAIFTYLKGIGTPAAFRVLQDQVKMGRVPASYLNQV